MAEYLIPPLPEKPKLTPREKKAKMNPDTRQFRQQMDLRRADRERFKITPPGPGKLAMGLQLLQAPVGQGDAKGASQTTQDLAAHFARLHALVALLPARLNEPNSGASGPTPWDFLGARGDPAALGETAEDLVEEQLAGRRAVLAYFAALPPGQERNVLGMGFFRLPADNLQVDPATAAKIAEYLQSLRGKTTRVNSPGCHLG